MGVSLVEDMVEILVSGITGIAEGIGAGLNSLVTNIFLTTGETTGLSVLGTVLLAFAGISLAIGLCRFVLNWLTSFGN